MTKTKQSSIDRAHILFLILCNQQKVWHLAPKNIFRLRRKLFIIKYSLHDGKHKNIMKITAALILV